MISSPMLLSFSTVFALCGFAFILLAGFSDNWLEYQVNRSAVFDAVNHDQKLGGQLREAVLRDPLYFPRTLGLVHICFPENVPADIGSFSKLGSPCITNRDYFPDTATLARYNSVQTQRLWIMRAQVASYAFGVLLIFVCLVVGIVGCYKRSAKITRTTGLILIFAAFFLAVSVALFHLVQYHERHLLAVYPFYQSWEPFLKHATRLTFGWSYVVFWIGLAFLFLAAIFLLFSYRAIKYEEDRIYESKHAAYYQQYYDKSLVPVSYGAPYGTGAAGYSMYGMPPPPPAAYYGHPAYASNYYGYMSYGS